MKSKNSNEQRKLPLKRDLKKGNTVVVITNGKTIGTGILIKKIHNGLNFINDDTITLKIPIEVENLGEKEIKGYHLKKKPLDKYPVFNSQLWQIKLIKSNNTSYRENEIYSFNITYLVGYFTDKNLPGSYDINEKEYLKWCKDENKLIDKFIEIDGIELF